MNGSTFPRLKFKFTEADHKEKCCVRAKDANRIILAATNEANLALATIESLMELILKRFPSLDGNPITTVREIPWTAFRTRMSSARCQLISELQNVAVAEEDKCLKKEIQFKPVRVRIDCP